MNEPDESTSDSDEKTIHHFKKIKKINEMSKHFTAVVQINGIKKKRKKVYLITDRLFQNAT